MSRSKSARLATACAVSLLTSAAALANPIPRDQTINFIPLSYPRMVAQTDANQRLHLFGDPSDPGYRDVAPRDGIDDRRAAALMSLAERFGPILVQNTSDAPMDFRRFMEFTETWLLHVDTWNLVGDHKTLLRSDVIDLLAAARHPCPPLQNRQRNRQEGIPALHEKPTPYQFDHYRSVISNRPQ